MKLKETLERFARNKATFRERETFDQWLKTLSLEEFKEVLEAYETALLGETSFDSYDKELLAKLMGRINENADPVLRKMEPLRRWKWPAYAAAIAAMAVLAIGWWMWKGPGGKSGKTDGISFIANRGERKNIRLPDGTMVTLNGGSELKLSAQFGRSDRNIAFEGEAYFKVVRNGLSPFIIHTPLMDVKVLGTELDVKSYADEKSATASLIKGKVAVDVRAGTAYQREYILSPMQKIIVASDETPGNTGEGGKVKNPHIDSVITGKKLSGPAETAWMKNKLVFPDQTLSEVTSTMEKWFGITIEIRNDSLRRIPYTGDFDNPDLRNVLETLQFTIPALHYKFINAGKVIIY